MSWIQESKGLTDICKIDMLYGRASRLHGREAICAMRQPVSIGYWPAHCDHQEQWSSFIKHPDYIISFFFNIWHWDHQEQWLSFIKHPDYIISFFFSIWHWVGKHDHQEEWSFSIFIGVIKVVFKIKEDDFLKTRMEIQAAWRKYDLVCMQNVTVRRYSWIWWVKEYFRNFGPICLCRKYVFHEETACLWNGLGWGGIEEMWESRRRAPSSPKKRQRGPDQL